MCVQYIYVGVHIFIYYIYSHKYIQKLHSKYSCHYQVKKFPTPQNNFFTCVVVV